MNSVVIVVANAMLFVVAVGAAVAWLLARRSTKLPFALTGVLALGLAGALATLAGALWDDPRPFVVDHVAPLIAHAADNGFPSDHATASAAIAAVVLFFNRRIGWVLAGLSLLLGMSRVMAEVHHWPDVLGGFALGALAAWLAHTVVEAAVRFVAERARMGPGSTSPADFAASAAASRVDMRAERAVCRTPVTHPPFTTVESRRGAASNASRQLLVYFRLSAS